MTTSEGQFSGPGWRCADSTGILPAGEDPVGAACALTFAETASGPPDMGSSPSIAELESVSTAPPAPSPSTASPTWRLTPRTEPLRRTGAQIAADPAHHQVVLFGGFRCQGASCFPTGDTWTWNGAEWTERHPDVSPPARYYGSMAFDPASARIVLFGGVGCADTDCDTATALADTWTWDGTTWTQQHPLLSPGPRYLAAMAGDAAAGHVVLFGGCLESCPAMAADTWTWDGSTWTLRLPADSPSARASTGIAYDAAHREVVLFGGSAPDTTATARDKGDTWTWDGSTWTQRSPATSPSPREGVGMTFDAVRGVIVLYGGYQADQSLFINAYRRDTWLWDGTVWRQQTGVATPPRTRNPGLAYDEVSGKALLIGGSVFSPIDIPCGGCGVVVQERETWLLDGTGWTKVPSTWPDERSTAGFGGMAYYPRTKSDIVSGGYCVDTPSFDCGDTWSWDGTRWTQLFLPRPTAHAMLVYDPETRQLLSVNGALTWVFDRTEGWVLVDRSGPRVIFAAVAQDPTGSVILFGGAGSDSSGRRFYPTAIYRWNGSAWVELSPPGRPPPGRQLAEVAYDPVRHRTVLFGGIGCGKPTPINSCPFTYLNDTWTWDGTIWTQQAPAASPPNRAFGLLVNDAGIERLLLFGGVYQAPASLYYATVNDTWSWNGTWAEEQPAASPSNLLNAYAADLPPAGTAALFGGQQDNPGRTVSDLWTWQPG